MPVTALEHNDRVSEISLHEVPDELCHHFEEPRRWAIGRRQCYGDGKEGCRTCQRYYLTDIHKVHSRPDHVIKMCQNHDIFTSFPNYCSKCPSAPNVKPKITVYLYF